MEPTSLHPEGALVKYSNLIEVEGNGDSVEYEERQPGSLWPSIPGIVKIIRVSRDGKTQIIKSNEKKVRKVRKEVEAQVRQEQDRKMKRDALVREEIRYLRGQNPFRPR